MPRFALGKNGVVYNVVQAETKESLATQDDVFEDANGTINVGDAYDVKDIVYDRLDVVTHKVIFQLVNDVRVLKGQGTITAAQYKNYVKGLI